VGGRAWERCRCAELELERSVEAVAVGSVERDFIYSHQDINKMGMILLIS
jgi:hypothetical protein